jgi:spore coat polysaccharide biosynthesis protein SpsF (cytidylyltransferase family)
MKIVAITQARTGSTRLPGKVLQKIGTETLLQLHLKRILRSKQINELMVATTTQVEDAEIIAVAGSLGVATYRGSVDDVLDRFYQALKGKDASHVVRLTSDCPLIDADLIDKIIQYAVDHDLDYCSNTLDPTYPDGQDVEVFKFAAFERAWREATLSSEREHVTPYIWKNSTYKSGTLFTSDNFNEGKSFGHLRMTVDEPKDIEVIRNLISALGNERSWLEYANYLDQNTGIKSLNESIVRNEGYIKSLKKEK